MSGARKERGRRAAEWVYLGASGVLQPLSTEFLYRSPHDDCVHACRWCGRPARGKVRAAR